MMKSNQSKKMKMSNTNYFDILPEVIIDRIFLFKNLKETFLESQELELCVKILRNEEKAVTKYIKQLEQIQTNIDNDVMNLLMITNDNAIDKANDIKIAEYQKIDNLLHEKILFELEEQHMIVDNLINIGNTIEQLEDNYAMILIELD